MNPNIHTLIKNEYDKRRKKAYEQLQERKTELYHAVPRLEEIEDEIHMAGVKYNKLILTGTLPSNSAISELDNTLHSLKTEKARLLAAYEYPPDFLSLVYTCEKCADTGFISSFDAADSVCVCYRQQLIDFIYHQSNLTLINSEGFKSFNTEYYADTADEHRYGIKKTPLRQILGIRENCQSFTDHFDRPDVKDLLFSGPTGVGKTFMAACIAVELMNRGYTVLYQTAPALFNIIYEYRYKYSREEAYENSVYKNILEVDLLILDDLGTESPSATRYAELLNIIDTRYANNRKKPCKTIIATNIDLKKLFEYYDERVVSRITGSFDIFKFAGDDIRRLKNLKSPTAALPHQ